MLEKNIDDLQNIDIMTNQEQMMAGGALTSKQNDNAKDLFYSELAWNSVNPLDENNVLDKMKMQPPKVVQTAVKDEKVKEKVMKRRNSEIKVKDANVLEARSQQLLEDEMRLSGFVMETVRAS